MLIGVLLGMCQIFQYLELEFPNLTGGYSGYPAAGTQGKPQGFLDQTLQTAAARDGSVGAGI
jgi:hypothetical protein